MTAISSIYPVKPKLPVILGLDTDKLPIRLIYADPENSRHVSPYVIQSRTFRKVESFCRYWTRLRAQMPNIIVAVPQITEDPLGLIVWLKSQQANIQRYPWLSYQDHLDGDFEILGLQKAFERPFALALYATYRLKSPMVAHVLWTKVSIARAMLGEICRGLQRLSAALPECDLTEMEDEDEQLELPF